MRKLRRPSLLTALRRAAKSARTITAAGIAAAAGLAITMVFAALVHARRGDPFRAMLPSMLLALGSVVVAWSRFGPYPL